MTLEKRMRRRGWMPFPSGGWYRWIGNVGAIVHPHAGSGYFGAVDWFGANEAIVCEGRGAADCAQRVKAAVRDIRGKS